MKIYTYFKLQIYFFIKSFASVLRISVSWKRKGFEIPTFKIPMFIIPMNQNTNRPFQNTNRAFQNTNGPFQNTNGPFQNTNGLFQNTKGPFQNTNLVGIMIIGKGHRTKQLLLLHAMHDMQYPCLSHELICPRN